MGPEAGRGRGSLSGAGSDGSDGGRRGVSCPDVACVYGVGVKGVRSRGRGGGRVKWGKGEDNFPKAA